MDPEVAEEIVRRRLAAQRLIGEPLETPGAVVGWLTAVQAQDFGPAKWAVGRRAKRATDGRLDRAYADGRILRTHVLRPTWHFVRPEDIRWLLTATAPGVLARMASRYRQLGLDADTLDRAARLLTGALRGGNRLMRREEADVLTRGGVPSDGQRLSHILSILEQKGLICSGPPDGKRHTHMLLEERAPQARDLPREAALAELARRYFASHGPATVRDYAVWATLSMADARASIEAAGGELTEETLGGTRFLSGAKAPAARIESPVVHLLQGYDEYVMGYRETKYLLARPGSPWSPATPPVFALLVVLDGRVAGFWRRTTQNRGVLIEVELLESFDDAQWAALEAEAARYGDYLGLAASVIHRKDSGPAARGRG